MEFSISGYCYVPCFLENQAVQNPSSELESVTGSNNPALDRRQKEPAVSDGVRAKQGV